MRLRVLEAFVIPWHTFRFLKLVGSSRRKLTRVWFPHHFVQPEMSPLVTVCFIWLCRCHLFRSCINSILFAVVFSFQIYTGLYLSNWLDGHFHLVCCSRTISAHAGLLFFIFSPQFQGSCYSRSIESTIGLDFLFSPPLYLSLPTSSRRKQNKEYIHINKKKINWIQSGRGFCVCVLLSFAWEPDRRW